MAAEPRGEARTRGRHADRGRNASDHGHTRDRQREPTEHARPPECTNHGNRRGERGTSRRGGTNHETKIRKKATPPAPPNPQKSRPNTEKSRPKRQKEAHATRGKPARKPTTNGKRDEDDTQPRRRGAGGDPPHPGGTPRKAARRQGGTTGAPKEGTTHRGEKPHTHNLPIFDFFGFVC